MTTTKQTKAIVDEHDYLTDEQLHTIDLVANYNGKLESITPVTTLDFGKAKLVEASFLTKHGVSHLQIEIFPSGNWIVI